MGMGLDDGQIGATGPLGNGAARPGRGPHGMPGLGPAGPRSAARGDAPRHPGHARRRRPRRADGLAGPPGQRRGIRGFRPGRRTAARLAGGGGRRARTGRPRVGPFDPAGQTARTTPRGPPGPAARHAAAHPGPAQSQVHPSRTFVIGFQQPVRACRGGGCSPRRLPKGLQPALSSTATPGWAKTHLLHAIGPLRAEPVSRGQGQVTSSFRRSSPTISST